MSTEPTDENSYFNVDKSFKELKPLHHTKPFWAIVAATLLLPIITAHLIYPLNLFNLIVLENGSELYKTSLVVGGACVTILTIYSLAYRSMETNQQIKIGTTQYRNTILEPIRTNHENLILELHSAIIHIMRIRDRLFHIESFLNNFVDTSDELQTKLKLSPIHIKGVLINDIKEIKSLSEKIFDNHPRTVGLTNTKITSAFDGSLVNISSMLLSLENAESEDLTALFVKIKNNFDTDFTDEFHEDIRKTESKYRQELSTIKREWL